MSYRIFITAPGIAVEAQKFLKSRNCVLQVGHITDSSDIISKKLAAFNPDGLIVRKGNITADVVNAPKNLKAICKHGIGSDNIDIEAANNLGIPVMFTPGANDETVAEHTLALMLALTRKITEQDRKIRSGVFDNATFEGFELLGKTLGIIGFGRIGRRLSELVAPFQMRVLVFHPSFTHETLAPYITKVPCVEDIFRRADIISLHCPLYASTEGMISKSTLDQMKADVMIINTSRGGIIDESDLYQGLMTGRIGGAALDVYETEPPPENYPYYKLNNVVLSAHTAGISFNSLRNMGMAAAKNVLGVLSGDPPDTNSLINREILEKR